STVHGRPALALDLMEEFRPIIVDSVVLTLLNNRMFTGNDFVTELGAYRLKDERRKVFFTKFEERLNEEINHPLFGYKVTYRRCVELQARILAKFVTGEIEEYVPFLIRWAELMRKKAKIGRQTTCYVIAYDIPDDKGRTK